MQYPVLANHLPDNINMIGGAACYESMGHSIALNKTNGAMPDDDEEAIESITLDGGIQKYESITNVSTKASTGALLANEADDNLSLSSSTRQSPPVNNINHNLSNGSTIVNMPTV